ncbi:MAG: hypothetical protein EOO15_05160 [Chitinophagaceae bacterium]|nr:MAG: hypothetical protein EOO15_05160 [Chitinophagaceae bacterium]
MEKTQQVRKPQEQHLTLVVKQETHSRSAAGMHWGEQEILALQEKARRFQRKYPAGGYQGL